MAAGVGRAAGCMYKGVVMNPSFLSFAHICQSAPWPPPAPLRSPSHPPLGRPCLCSHSPRSALPLLAGGGASGVPDPQAVLPRALLPGPTHASAAVGWAGAAVTAWRPRHPGWQCALPAMRAGTSSPLAAAGQGAATRSSGGHPPARHAGASASGYLTDARSQGICCSGYMAPSSHTVWV